MRFPRPQYRIPWPLLFERSDVGARVRARVVSALGFALLVLGLLWVLGYRVVVVGLFAACVVVIAVLELAARARAVGIRRAWTVVGAAVRSCLRSAVAALESSVSRLRRAAAAAAAERILAVRRQLPQVARVGAEWRRAVSSAAAGRRATRRSDAVATERDVVRLNALGTRLRRAGAAEAALQHHHAALALVRELGDRRAEAFTLNNVALALSQTDADGAVACFEEARSILSEIGDTQHEGQVIANLGVAHRRLGDVAAATRLLETALTKLDPDTPAHRQVEEQLRRAS